MDVAALYGLCADGGRANLQSAWDRTMRGMKASGEAREIIGVDAAGIGAVAGELTRRRSARWPRGR